MSHCASTARKTARKLFSSRILNALAHRDQHIVAYCSWCKREIGSLLRHTCGAPSRTSRLVYVSLINNYAVNVNGLVGDVPEAHLSSSRSTLVRRTPNGQTKHRVPAALRLG